MARKESCPLTRLVSVLTFSQPSFSIPNDSPISLCPENTRPRPDRCSAHRVGAPALHRPRSRPVFGLPRRQLASDPSVPVEGGSCNDYDYVCGDPVNGLDLGGYAAQPALDVKWMAETHNGWTVPMRWGHEGDRWKGQPYGQFGLRHIQGGHVGRSDGFGWL